MRMAWLAAPCADQTFGANHPYGASPRQTSATIPVTAKPIASGSNVASDAQRALYAAVRDAQLAAIRGIRTGANGRDVHRRCVEVFEARGFRTKHGKRGSVGFFHGTGHGLGLAVHEAPRMSGSIDYTLRGGSVVTVEPGLYYPGLGGCRVEDVVQVTSGAPKLLSRYHYEWEFRG